jgi:hypothetical protein
MRKLALTLLAAGMATSLALSGCKLLGQGEDEETEEDDRPKKTDDKEKETASTAETAAATPPPAPSVEPPTAVASATPPTSGVATSVKNEMSTTVTNVVLEYNGGSEIIDSVPAGGTVDKTVPRVVNIVRFTDGAGQQVTRQNELPMDGDQGVIKIAITPTGSAVWNIESLPNGQPIVLPPQPPPPIEPPPSQPPPPTIQPPPPPKTQPPPPPPKTQPPPPPPPKQPPPAQPPPPPGKKGIPAPPGGRPTPGKKK